MLSGGAGLPGRCSLACGWTDFFLVLSSSPRDPSQGSGLGPVCNGQTDAGKYTGFPFPC